MSLNHAFTSIRFWVPLALVVCPLIEASTASPPPIVAKSPLRARGASSLSGEVDVIDESDGEHVDLTVSLRGAAPGSYDVVVSDEPCGAMRSVLQEPYALPSDGPAWSPTSEEPQLEDPSAHSIGCVDVDDEGEGRLEISLPSRFSDGHAILVREVPGTINPALGDPYGYVACGRV
jgi:hypothetical protein